MTRATCPLAVKDLEPGFLPQVPHPSGSVDSLGGAWRELNVRALHEKLDVVSLRTRLCMCKALQ